jgi:hypothetical protein
MKEFHVYSTLANDNLYMQYSDSPNGIPARIGDGVTIQGGAGVADARMWTPRGVRTTVSAEQLAYLQACPTFVKHVERGFVVVEGSKVDPEQVAPNMSDGDLSRPLTEGDSALDGVDKVTTGDPAKTDTAQLPKGAAATPRKRGAGK